MAAFKEKVKALAARNICSQSETRSTAESSAIPVGVPRDVNPGGYMILTPPDTQDEQMSSSKERGSFQDIKSG